MAFMQVPSGFIQVPPGLYSGPVLSWFRCCMVVIQVPSGVYAGAAWPLFRLALIHTMQPTVVDRRLQTDARKTIEDKTSSVYDSTQLRQNG